MKRVLILTMIAIVSVTHFARAANHWHKVVLPSGTHTWRSPVQAQTIKAYASGKPLFDKEISYCTGMWESKQVVALVRLCGTTFRVHYSSSVPITVMWAGVR